MLGVEGVRVGDAVHHVVDPDHVDLARRGQLGEHRLETLVIHSEYVLIFVNLTMDICWSIVDQKPANYWSYLRLVDLGGLGERVVDGDGEGVVPDLVVRLLLHSPLTLRHVCKIDTQLQGEHEHEHDSLQEVE